MGDHDRSRRVAFLVRLLLAALGIACLAGPVSAQEPAAPWEFSVLVYGYDVPDSEDYWNPNFTADTERLHLEARHNYEAIDTNSAWVGANFSAGTNWEFHATLMAGGVFGDLEGLAPGFRLSVERAWFGFASEGEYFIDNHDSDENYFYSWSEIWGAPSDWFRAGIAVQRTRAYESDLSIQRGAFVAFTYKDLDVAAYVFNIAEDPTYVIAVKLTF